MYEEQIKILRYLVSPRYTVWKFFARMGDRIHEFFLSLGPKLNSLRSIERRRAKIVSLGIKTVGYKYEDLQKQMLRFQKSIVSLLNELVKK